MENQTKQDILDLLEFVKQLSITRQKVVSNIAKQLGSVSVHDLAQYPELVSLFSRTDGDGTARDGELLLRIVKPELEPCPVPPEVLLPWLRPGWESWKKEAAHLAEKVYPAEKKDGGSAGDAPAEVREPFEASPERVAAYAIWVRRRAVWVERQKRLVAVQALFANLYDMYNMLRQQPENFEMMAGNGALTDSKDSSINHPVLLKRVGIELIAKENTILVSDTDAEPEVYVMLLSALNDVHNDTIKAVEDDARERNIHPFDHLYGRSLLKGLTTRLTSDSNWLDEGKEPEEEARIVIRWMPVFFLRKRMDGTARTIDIIKEEVKQDAPVPKTVINIVNPTTLPVDKEDETMPAGGHFEANAYSPSVDEAILFSKPANKEQLEIAKQVQHQAAVLVQGPPGTGKTHTIANLISHFLAQGKRILITSQTNKALRVLKEKIPEPLQPLCVAMLDDSNEDMERSVDGIVEYITTRDIEQARQRAESRRKKRNVLQQELNAAETLVRQIRHMEFEPIAWCGDSLSPAKAAALIAAQVEKLDIIPGDIAEGEPFPLTEAELQELYFSNGFIDANEETEMDLHLPDAHAMIPPDIAARFWKNADNAQGRLYEIGEGTDRHFAWSQEDYNIVDTYTGTAYAHSGDVAFVEKLKALYQQYPEDPTTWMIRAVVDGAVSGLRKRRWDVLLDSIHSTCDLARDAQKALTGHTISVAPSIGIPTLAAQYDQLCQLASVKGKISPFLLLGRKELKGAIDAVSLDGLHPSTYGEMQLVLQWLMLQKERDQLVRLWDELMSPLGQPSATAFGSAPEEMLQQKAADLRFWLTWAAIGYPALVQTIQQAGIDLALFNGLEHANLTNEQVVTSILSELHGQIGRALVMAACIQLLSEPARLIRETQVLLNCYEDSALCRLQLKAILEHDAEAYAQHYTAFVDLASKMPLLIRRHELLGKIKQVAPMWAEAINQRAGIHGLVGIPEGIQESWHLKKLDIIVQRICTTPLTDTERRVSRLKVQYQRATEALATDMAWYLLSKRIEGDLRIQATLIGWKQTIKRIGKGTGKNAGALQKQAQELMAASQQAVPAWIMPIGKVMDSVDPSQVKFDIVIIDEASQADITAIPLLFMGKKVIVVGDDEQVSPMAIGIPDDKMNALRATYIKGRIPNWHLYDATYSIYALACSICKPLMLREHFRCVPDIIGYSNWLSYEGKIKPLREAGSVMVQPAVVPFRIEGQRKGKINLAEAEAIVAAIKAFMEMPVYREETFGIISMLGDEQVKLIEKLLFEHISLVDRENRRILCGTASNFQGDERSVVFLSLVDSNEGDGPLRLMTEGKADSTKQRYNVAVSRAQNQIWIVHSMDPAESLKTGDIRRGLLDYAKDPNSYCQKIKQIERDSESLFEEEVAKSLVTAGYQVTQQYPVGGYRLDMVVSCKGKRIALECDGERYHRSEEEFRNDAERQNILERLGWQFIRLRGSEYFRDKKRAIERVKQNLNEAGIVPEVSSIGNTDLIQDALKQKVTMRIQQIVRSWHLDDDEPDSIPIAEKPTIQPHDQRSTEHPPAASNSGGDLTAIDAPIPEAVKGTTQEKPTPAKPNIAPSLKKPVHAGQTSSRSVVEQANTSTPRAEQIHWGDVIQESKPQGGFLKALDAASLEYIDNRSTSGILWVLYNADHKAVFEKLAAVNGIRVTLERRGAVATDNRPAWRIMKNYIKE